MLYGNNITIQPVSSQITPGLEKPQRPDASTLTEEFDIPISYPVFWDKVVIPEIQAALFMSPIKTVGALVQHISQVSIPIDEFLTNLLLLLRENLLGLNFVSSNSIKLSDGSQLEILEYTFGNSSNIYRVLQIMKLENGELYSFTYFADEGLHSRFLPMIKNMVDSMAHLPNKNELTSAEDYNTQRNSSSNFKSQSILKDADNFNNVSLSELIDVFPASELLNYNNPYLGISLGYPASFNKTELDNGVGFTFDDGFSGLVMVVNPTTAQSLENYTIERLTDLQSKTDNFTLVGIDEEEYFVNPTQISLFNYINNSQVYQGTEFVTLDNQDAYVFTYYSHNNTFDDNLELISNIWDTVQLRNLQRVN
jgi:hypothetical protein